MAAKTLKAESEVLPAPSPLSKLVCVIEDTGALATEVRHEVEAQMTGLVGEEPLRTEKEDLGSEPKSGTIQTLTEQVEAIRRCLVGILTGTRRL